jgi:hypothetical protein
MKLLITQFVKEQIKIVLSYAKNRPNLNYRVQEVKGSGIPVKNSIKTKI